MKSLHLYLFFVTGLFVLGMSALVLAEGDKVLTLNESFQRALERSESFAIQEETIHLAESHFLQSLGSVLPHVSFNATEFVQDTSGANADGSVASTLIRRSRPELAVNLTQPLFQGFREFNALRASRAEKSQNTLQTKRAKQSLFLDVAQAYYTVLEIEKEVQIWQLIRETLEQRVTELSERIRLGKSRESERLTTESQLAGVEADLEKARGLSVTARDLLGFITGESVQEHLVDEFHLPPFPAPLENYLDKLVQRPDIQATTESLMIAEQQLKYQKGGHYPTINLASNYYPYRVGFYQNIHWDVTLSASFPLFQGGAITGNVHEAFAKFRQAQLNTSASRRHGELDVRQAYDGFSSSRRQEIALERAEAKAKESYRIQQQEYQQGVVTNLEVLQALRDWQGMELTANAVQYDTKLKYLQLLVASGDISLEDQPTHEGEQP